MVSDIDDPDQPLAEIVRRRPEFAQVFLRRGALLRKVAGGAPPPADAAGPGGPAAGSVHCAGAWSAGPVCMIASFSGPSTIR